MHAERAIIQPLSNRGWGGVGGVFVFLSDSKYMLYDWGVNMIAQHGEVCVQTDVIFWLISVSTNTGYHSPPLPPPLKIFIHDFSNQEPTP